VNTNVTAAVAANASPTYTVPRLLIAWLMGQSALPLCRHPSPPPRPPRFAWLVKRPADA
jgi:hypothetical protein